MKFDVINSVISSLALIGTAINSYVQFNRYRKQKPTVLKEYLLRDNTGIHMILTVLNNAPNNIAIQDLYIKARYLGLYTKKINVKWYYQEKEYTDNRYVIEKIEDINILLEKKYYDKYLSVIIKTAVGNCKYKFRLRKFYPEPEIIKTILMKE